MLHYAPGMKLARAAALLLVSVFALVGLSAPSQADPATTKISLTVVDCNGCVFSAYNFRSQTYLGEGKVKSGKATITVERAGTKGLGFFVQNSAKNPQYDAQWLAVIRYAGLKAGKKVTNAQSLAAKRGMICWVGTSKATVSMRVMVKHFKTKDNAGRTVDGIRTYLSPAASSIGKGIRVYKGQAGTQGVVDCDGSFSG